MHIFAGTSGFSYKEWKGSFYPQDLPAKEMLRYYSTRLPAVEINNTFYRMPLAETLKAWAEAVGPDFRFILKAPRKITHTKPLVDKTAEVLYLFETASAGLGARLGPILFQLPPYLHKNIDLLSAFFESLPVGAKAAIEFRHRSWFDEEVYSLMRAKRCALCCSDGENQELRKLAAVADWGYLRLRRQDYTDAELKQWAETIGSFDWREVYVFFKHEEAGTGPELAKRFLEVAH
jgi:uncharacterized protein YecE (DUF72 family)